MKMRQFTIHVFLFFMFVSQALLAQNGPAEDWNYFAGGSKVENSRGVLECSDGGSLLVGQTDSNDGMVTGQHGLDDAWVVKRRPNGTAEWQQCIGSRESEEANQAVEVSDGYVIVGHKDYNAWIFKINKSGTLIWERTYPSNNPNRQSELFAIRKKSDGTFMVGGYTNGYLSNAMLWNISSTGNLLNGVSFTVGNIIKEIRFTSDGNMIVMGGFTPVEEGCYQNSEVPCYGDLWLAKVSTNYQLIWNKYYGGTTCDVFIDGEITSNNEVYILGRTYCKGQVTGPNNIGKDWNGIGTEVFTWLAKVNASGNLGPVEIVTFNVWDNSEEYHCVTVDCKGQPVIGGEGGYFFGGNFPVIAKRTTDLKNIVWKAELTGSTSEKRVLYDIQFTTEANYLAGGLWDYADNKYDPNFFVLKTLKDPDCAGSANKCQNITPISCGQTYTGNTSGRSSAFGINDLSSCHSSTNPFSAGDQLFEIYKPNSIGDLVVTLFSTNIDHDIFLLSNCNPVQCLYKSTASVSGNGNNIEIIRVNNAPAGYYYILVDGPTASQTGPFTLTVNCGLLDCGNAKPIECKQTLSNESNQNGFNNVSLYCNPSKIADPGTGCTGKEKVYTFLLNSNQNVTINLTNIRDPNDDFEMFLFKDCNEDVCLATSTNPKGQNETINTNLTSGRYYIVVDGWKESEGAYDISVDWNCCTNAIELYNCGYVTYKYTGNGSNLQFTFTSTKAIAPGKKWKVGNNEIQTAGSTVFQYNFPNPGEYVICFPYLNANNCLEYCCYRVWISNPFECFDFDYKFNPNTNNFSFTLNLPGATNIIWKDDSTGGTIGGGPISNPLPLPPVGGCVEKTITVSYYLNGRWFLCCRKIWICNPFDCLEFDYRYDLNSNGMVFSLNTPGATYITWKDDTGGGDIGGGPISNPVPVPPNPGDCIERIISVKYFANGRWYICCRRVWICNPFDCLEFDYRYDLNSSGMVFSLNTPGATYITWKDDTGGGDIGGGPISNPVPVPPNPGDCIERIISVKYFANGRWYICCRRVWICNPFNCLEFDYRYDLNFNGMVFNLNTPGASNITWKDDTGGGDIGGGTISNPVPVPPNPGDCIERIISVKYFANGRWYICCRKVWVCNPFDCADISFRYNVATNAYQFQLNQGSATQIIWKDDTGGGEIGGGPISNPVPPPSTGPCVEKIITARYFYNGRWYLCCKRFWLCDPKQCALNIQSRVSPTGQVNLDVAATYKDVIWIDQKTGNVLGTGPSIQTNFPYGSNQEICVQYSDQGKTYMCCKSIVVVGTNHSNTSGVQVQVYPNPVNDVINVLLICDYNNNFRISLINLYGIEIETIEAASCDHNLIKIHTEKLSDGVYFIKVIGEKYQTIHKIEIMH